MSAELLRHHVSRETLALLGQYEELLQKWNTKINLVSSGEMPHFFNRHILDCLQILPLIPSAAKSLTDFGSGGGLPGLILAIDAKLNHSDRMVTLVESDQRKSTFLRTVIRELQLPATVLIDRIENVDLAPADVVTARALAPLSQLLAWTETKLSRSGKAIFPKGRSAASEIELAQKGWHFDCKEVQSVTDREARILVIKDIRRDHSR